MGLVDDGLPVGSGVAPEVPSAKKKQKMSCPKCANPKSHRAHTYAPPCVRTGMPKPNRTKRTPAGLHTVIDVAAPLPFHVADAGPPLLLTSTTIGAPPPPTQAYQEYDGPVPTMVPPDLIPAAHPVSLFDSPLVTAAPSSF